MEKIIDIDTVYGQISVIPSDKNGFYDVYVNNECKHPNCTSEDAMRALGSYMIALDNKVQTLQDRVYDFEYHSSMGS